VTDPRIDTIGPSRLTHLTLAEVEEFKRLSRVGERRRFTPRYMELMRRLAPGWRDRLRPTPEAA